MPIDPRIALGVQAPQIESPMNVMANALKLRAMQNENALFEQQQRTAAAQAERQNALNALLSSNPNLNAPDVQARVLGLGGADLLKSYADIQKSGMERQKAQQEMDISFWKQARDELATLDPADQAGYQAWATTMIQKAPWTARLLPPTIDAKNKDRLLQTAETALPKGVVTEVPGALMTTNPYTGQPIGEPVRTPLLSPQQLAQQAGLKAAGAPRVSVNAVDTATDKAMKDFIGDLKDRRSQLVSSPTTIENLQQARTLINDARNFVGTGGEPLLQAAKFLNNRLGFGIDTKGVTKAEELRSRLFNGVLENLRKLDAQPTAQQQLVLQQSIGSLETDPDALPKVIGVWEDIVRSKVESYNADVASAEEQGVRFPYKAKIELPPRAAAADESVEVNVPGRGPVRFPNKKAADDFKKAAGL